MILSSSLSQLKAINESKARDEKASSDRRRDCLVLILHHLQQLGYSQTASQLQHEAGRFLLQHENADNVDLLHILSDYEEFHFLKYGKKPKFVRKVLTTTDSKEHFSNRLESKHPDHIDPSENFTTYPNNINLLSKRQGWKVARNYHRVSAPPPITSSVNSHISRRNSCNHDLAISFSSPDQIGGSGVSLQEHDGKESTHRSGCDEFLVIEGQKKPSLSKSNHIHEVTTSLNSSARDEFRTIKPLPSFGGDAELRALAASIHREILDQSPGVTWDEIISLDDAKKILIESVILPLKYPPLFQGLLEPWRSVLLYGPPGTGKTLLARAVATESSATFFNVSASSLVSKFRGDSEKLIRILFILARHYSPSTIFIDEIDSIMGSRGNGRHGMSSHSTVDRGGEGSGSTEHEGSRRMKTELLVEMDGLGRASGQVFVLVATNMPWDLDPAFLRRLEKRIMVPMPIKEARKMMLQSYLSRVVCCITDVEFDHFASVTENYSGADIKLVCKEAAMRPIRDVIKDIERVDSQQQFRGSNHNDDKAPSKTDCERWTINQMLQRYPVTAKHLQESLSCTMPSVGTAIRQRYVVWGREFGSVL